VAALERSGHHAVTPLREKTTEKKNNQKNQQPNTQQTKRKAKKKQKKTGNNKLITQVSLVLNLLVGVAMHVYAHGNSSTLLSINHNKALSEIMNCLLSLWFATLDRGCCKFY